MGLRLFNTMGREMQDFVPITEGFAGFYGCGPTVYNYAHIGNLRAYVFLDTLDRTLTFLGYDKKHVMNITDIGHLTGDSDEGEDKMLKTAKERHESVLEVAQFYTNAFLSDIDSLNIIRPDVICKATDHIAEMIDLIKRIEANGHTYMAGGNLYYDVSTYPQYGDLAGLDMDKLKAGARIDIDQNKRSPYDFVLWFTKSKFENQAMTWDSPWGRGYPGWHIECSAMSMKYLGEHFDIHTGGIDHIPIHHTNEIAQSEGATGTKWVNYWLHNEFLVVAKDSKGAKDPKNSGDSQDSGEGTKMSKSSGNFLRLQTLLDKGFSPLDYRFFLLGTHYRKQIYFSDEAMTGAKKGREALVQRLVRLAQNAGKDTLVSLAGKTYAKGEAAGLAGLSGKAAEYLNGFRAGIENDLSTPVALSQIQKAVKDSSLAPAEALELVARMDSVTGLNLLKTALEAEKAAAASVRTDAGSGGTETADQPGSAADPEAAEIDALVAERQQAKAAKNFARADEIRKELAGRGITLTDTPNGPVWKRV
ncbi:MAG: cysteine--tRNA ligase [Treponema sp.]|nr:cysteine--tRNA ligase [Treponema sp.]